MPSIRHYKRSSFIQPRQPSKSDIRQLYRDIRQQILVSHRHEAAMLAASHLAKHPIFKKSDHIACYLAYQDEIDTMPLIQAIWRANKQCYLPILTEGRSLQFVRYDEGDALQPNQFSILEPENMSRKLAPEKLNLVILPLVAFDLQGHRLGTGGGYYDRTFAFMHDTQSDKPTMLGFAYAAQQADALPADPWDVLLNGVATEKEVIIF